MTLPSMFAVWRARWSRSARLRLGALLGGLAVGLLSLSALAGFEVVKAALASEVHDEVDALRAQTWTLVAVLADTRTQGESRRRAIETVVEELDRRVQNRALSEALEASDPSQERQGREWWHAAAATWRGQLRPLALDGIDAPAARDAFMSQVAEYMASLDALVVSVDAHAQHRLKRVLTWLALAGVLLATGAGAFVWLLWRHWLAPVEELVRVTDHLRRGDFSVRVAPLREDELGQLGQAFNLMIEEVARLTDSLEHQIADGTADLAQRNRLLTLLYQVTRKLSEHAADERTLTDVLALLQLALDRTDLIGCALRLSHAGAAAGELVADRYDGQDLNVSVGASGEFGPPHHAAVIAVTAGAAAQGTLTVWLRARHPLEPWQHDLAVAIARHIGAARAAGQWHEEHRRAAVLQERTAIARELHDSLAQTLSYTRIQIVRLAALLETGSAATAAPARDVLTELRDGVTLAYRQLRELLTQFRLGVGEAGLSGAMRVAIEDFERRTRSRILIDNELIGDELSAHVQAHVLQIVREALSNVERHANATETRVRLSRYAPGHAEDEAGAPAAIEVVIEDNGVGIGPPVSGVGHFGLAIMRDRARAIGGGLTVERRRVEDGGGTRVRLRVPLAAVASAVSAATLSSSSADSVC